MEAKDSLKQKREAKAEEIESCLRGVMEEYGFDGRTGSDDVVGAGEEEGAEALGIQMVGRGGRRSRRHS